MDSNIYSSVFILHAHPTYHMLHPTATVPPLLVQVRMAAQTQGHRTLLLTTGCVLVLAGGLAPVRNCSTLGLAFDMVSEVHTWCADLTSHWATVFSICCIIN